MMLTEHHFLLNNLINSTNGIINKAKDIEIIHWVKFKGVTLNIVDNEGIEIINIWRPIVNNTAKYK